MTATSPPATPATEWLACEHAWLGNRMGHDVLLGIDRDGTFTHVEERAPGRSSDSSGPPDGAPSRRLRGIVLPGLVNAHSHAFHRALRGRVQPGRSIVDGGSGNFWRWREAMYDVAARLDPDSLHAVARAVYGEMALAGITCVGEFHYLHHQADGRPYDDPNAIGRALIAAAHEAGIRLTLLDTLYLTGHVGATLTAPDLDPLQRRFSDGTAHRWAARVAELDEHPTGRIGAAIHSVRAVPPDSMTTVADLVRTPDGPVRVLHAHVAEQRDEVDNTHTIHGLTPVELLADARVLSDRFTAVHAVWLDADDVDLLRTTGATVCACPTTERDLADGIVDGAALATAGIRLALGTDQHAVVDLFEEARALELDQRLVTGTRGHHDPADLLAAATVGGADSLGWPELGRIEVGAPADLAVVSTDSVRLAGTRDQDLAAAVVYAATAADVTATMVGGRWIVEDGRHTGFDVAADLADVLVTLGDRTGGRSTS